MKSTAVKMDEVAPSSKGLYKKGVYSNEEEIHPAKRSSRLTDKTIRRKYLISKKTRARKDSDQEEAKRIAALERDAQAGREETLEEWAERVAAEYNDAELARQARADEEYRIWAEKQAAERQL